MTRVYLKPKPDEIPLTNGVGKVVHAQYKHLPALGIEFVHSPEEADVIAGHISADLNLPRLDCLHNHGAYFTAEPDGLYTAHHHESNAAVVSSARRARYITVPSRWVGEMFRRDMRIDPVVIGHGIDVGEWQPGTNGGYVLWNKNRHGDVCDPRPAMELARRGVKVIATFAPVTKQLPHSIQVIGPQTPEKMKQYIANADIYLCTTPETFGIGKEQLLCNLQQFIFCV